MPIGTASQIVALRSPEFSSDPRLGDYILLARQQLSATIFGTNYEYAVALVVLHWLTLEKRGGGSSTTSTDGTAGAIKSEKEGDLSRSYGELKAPTGAEYDSYWMATNFGAEFVHLRRSTILAPMNRMIP